MDEFAELKRGVFRRLLSLDGKLDLTNALLDSLEREDLQRRAAFIAN